MEKGIYTRIPEERLSEILENLQQFTGLSMELIDEEGALLLSFGPRNGYCAKRKTAVFDRQECADVHAKAGRYARTVGEAYMFSCQANLHHIAFSLTEGEVLLGSVIVGPFLLDGSDSTLLQNLAQRRRLSADLSLELYDALSGVPVLSPRQVNPLKKLIENLFTPLLPGERALLLQTPEKLSRQAQPGEARQGYKEEGEEDGPARFFYEMEPLSRVAVGGVAHRERCRSERLCEENKGNLHVRRALFYMSQHFSTPLTVAEVAKEVGISATYLSALFRQAVGVPFREHLSRLRVEKSKQLLLSTGDSLADIAAACGFSDQSRYCKVFRRLSGITPGKFRAAYLP